MRCVVTFGCLFFPMIALGGVESLIDQVEKKYTDVEVLKADFTQTSRSPLYGDQEQKGEVTLKRPSKMRWDFSGDGKRFVTDGQTMWIYDPNAKQVIRYNDFTAASATADSLLQSLDKLSTLFEITEVETPGADHVLDLKPKDEGQVKALRLTLDEGLTVKQVVVTDLFDSVTELTFGTVTLGGEVSDAFFSFEVPEGVSVLDAGAP
jgi:outer membrane lipoprotein carrier protein